MKRSPAILIATLGSEPQVVTATLELLCRQGEVIQRVEVVHTVAPLELPLANAVETLREAFSESPGGVSPSASPEFELHPIYDEKGQPVTDVETPASIEAALRVVYRLVHRAKKAAYRVHLSIAGERKTMAVFGMLAGQLLEEKLTQARAFMLGSLSAAERSVVTLLVKEGLGDKSYYNRPQ